MTAMSDLVKVKRLEWRKSINFDGSNSWKNDPYRIDHYHAPADQRGYALRIDGQKAGTFPVLDAAKAAAQSDYIARILAALDLTAVEALEAENKRLREAFEESTAAYVAVYDDRDRLRNCLCRLLAASINDMTARGLPPEWSERSPVAEAFAALGVVTDRLTPEARAVLGDDQWITDAEAVELGALENAAALKEADNG